ncbi:MAG: hypothetical protein RLZ32_128, partial [Gemmatimonadota bacterium]
MPAPPMPTAMVPNDTAPVRL